MMTELPEREALRALTALTKNKDEWPESVSELLRLLSRDSVKVKAKALWLLGETGLLYPALLAPHIPAIAAFLFAKNGLLRERALNALGRIGRGDYHLIEPHLNDMKPLARDAEPDVRLAFIWACENIATNAPTLFENDLPLFASLLGDENERVRIEAPEIFRVLGQRIPSYVAPYLTKLQDLAEHDREPVVRIHAKGAIKAATQNGEKQ